jgi:hypothetical protein
VAPDRSDDERADDSGRRGTGHDDAETLADDGRSTSLPPKLERWRRRSAAGAIMTAAALGLQQVFEPERKEPAIMLETSGNPPDDLPVDVEMDGFTAKQSVMRIRPWLLDRATEARDSHDEGTPDGVPPLDTDDRGPEPT